MCDYSLHTAKSRPARVGDRLVTRNFNTGTRGFAAPEDARTAVCVLPGTELAFDKELQSARIGLFGWKVKTIEHTTAIFRQINKSQPHTHHDALEFPDGHIELLTELSEVRQQRCFSFRLSQLPRPRRRLRKGSRTPADRSLQEGPRPSPPGRPFSQRQCIGPRRVPCVLVH